MQSIISLPEKYDQLILDTERFIWEHPETGYKEYVTSKYMELPWIRHRKGRRHHGLLYGS